MEQETSFNSDLFLAIQENVQVFNPLPVTKQDINRARKIAYEIIKLYNKKEIQKSHDISFSELLISSLGNLYQVGIDNIISEATSIIKDLEYRELDESKVSLFITNSEVVNTGTGFAKKAKSIFVPSHLTAVSSFFMSHEVIHILKERNPKECQNVNTLAETLPMLIELICAFNNKNYAILKEILYERIELLYYEARHFFTIIRKLKENNENAMSLKASLYSTISYLNSFYYTLSLFTLYLEDEDYIINQIKSNLTCHITTQEINKNLCCDNDDTLYQKGLSLISKNLK